MLELVWTCARTFLIYSLVLTMLMWCAFQWKYWPILQAARKLPVVLTPNLPIIGHLYTIVMYMSGSTGVAAVMEKQWTTAMAKGYYTMCFWIGPFPAMIFTKPDDIKKLLNNPSTMSKGYELCLMNEYIGTGLITAPAEHWKLTRRHMNPVFHPRNVEMMMPNFNRNSRELVHILSEHVGKQPVDLHHPLTDISLKSVCELVFGPEMRFDIKSEAFQGLHTFAEMILRLLVDRMMKPWLRNYKLFKFLYRKELKIMDETWKRFSEVAIKEAKRNYEIKKKVGLSKKTNEKTQESTKEFLTTVDVYCELQESFKSITDKEMVEELITIFMAGTDTVTVSLASSLLAMAQYQDIQEKVYQEISSAVGPEEDVKIEDLKKFPYMEKVIKESLRLFTVVPFITRLSAEPITISDITYPAGTSFLMCLAGLHMDPHTFPEPESFNPDRWTPEITEELDRYAYIPFSGGPRNCPGKQYAYMLMKVMLVHILRNFHLSTTQDIHNLKRKFVITMINNDGYKISLKNRGST